MFDIGKFDLFILHWEAVVCNLYYTLLYWKYELKWWRFYSVEVIQALTQMDF